MTHDQFKVQIQRLCQTFGEKNYPQDRVTLMWREMGALDAAFFTRIVDRFIMESRNPPMAIEFREAIAIERERTHSKDKQQFSRDSREFYSIVDEKTMISPIMAKIQARMAGTISDEEWSGFVKSVSKL